jgi:hypothetical protein
VQVFITGQSGKVECSVMERDGIVRRSASIRHRTEWSKVECSVVERDGIVRRSASIRHRTME